MAERRRAVPPRRRLIRRLLVASAVLVYIPVVHYWRTTYTTRAVLTQVGEGTRQTMEVFASRIPPALRALSMEASLAAALVADPERLGAAAERIRAIAGADQLSDSGFAVVVLDSAGNTRWSSASLPDSVVERVASRQPAPGGGSVLLRKIGGRYVIDVAVPSISTPREMVAVRVPPRSLFYGPLQPPVPNDPSSRTSLLAVDGGDVVLVATEGADTLPSLGPWSRDGIPRSIASALEGRTFGGQDRDLWGREMIVGTVPLALPGIVLVRQRSEA